MTGLDLILDKIIESAKKTADENMKKAKEKASEIEAEYAKKITEAVNAEEQYRSDCIKTLKERAENEKRAYERSMLLEQERKAAKTLIEAAKKKIYDMPTEEYFEFLAEIFKNQCDLQGGEIVFSKEDKEKLPEDFLSKLGANFTLSDDEIKEKGFVVRQGRIEVNCTIEAIFKSIESKLYDIACRKE